MNGSLEDNEQQSVFGNNIEFLTLSPELIFESKSGKGGISVNMSNGLSGKQVLGSPAYNIGLFMKI